MAKWRFQGMAAAALLITSSVVLASCASPETENAATQAVSNTTSVSTRAVIPEVTADRNMHEVTVKVAQAGKTATLDVRVAASEAERETGLMWITTMPADSGMLFLFARDVETGFWMQNTYLPLDIAYVSSSGKLLGVNEGKPLDTTILNPPAPYRYVIETNQGWWAEHGFTAGANVALPGDLSAVS